ncbi:tetratricopeptide repeat protein [Amycolatopsis sp. Hca4]|uniref:ATP-binding protein n=1 Tax=Amycolatopsis sp. Hca4 TaxID=2742131 RepID=UPI00158FDB33|nr:tetratricopeptide repeat protein [Amycolatopsis sp. Hca4]QKV73233.1 tetratricopeptide repeat protein [Amycolatopsis sp. Hca4]
MHNHIDGGAAGVVLQAGTITGDVWVAAPRSPHPVPRQLPPSPSHFTSRAAELAALDEVAGQETGGQPALAVLIGPGGVGKTAVAVTWGSRHAGRYPDGQLYADLRGFSPGTAVLPDEALGAFLRALGVAPEHVPPGLAEQAALFRTLTAGRRLLVLLDNALSAAQVRPLIPASAGCTVVVTSRLRLDGLVSEGARFLDVAPLAQPHAVELVVNAVGRTRVAGELDDVAELATLCGRLPIALRVAAARLASRPRWPVARVVAELGDENSRLSRLSAEGEAPVAATFDWSYRALPEPAAKLYRLLGEFPGASFGVDVAVAATELADPADGLQQLVDASLLEEVDERRYRFHDLVRLHARAQRDDDRFEVLPRVATWYLHAMTRANMVAIPIRWRVSPVCEQYRTSPPAFGSGRAALDWLDEQLPNVLAVLEEAAAQRHDEVAWQLCEALWELFLHRKHFPLWLRSHEIGIGAAQRCRNVVAESRLRCQLGRAYLDLGRFEAAEQECGRALELARAAGSRHNESVALDQLGTAAQGRGDVAAAIACYTGSLEIEAELGIDRGVAQRHRRIGEVLAKADRDPEALAHLERARRMFADMGDEKDEAKVLVGLARLDARAGDVPAARRRLERAWAVLSESGSAVYQADVLVGFADVAEHGDDPAAARGHLAEALKLYEQVGGPQVTRVRARLQRYAAEVGEPAATEDPEVGGDAGEGAVDHGEATGAVPDDRADGGDGEPGQAGE